MDFVCTCEPTFNIIIIYRVAGYPFKSLGFLKIFYRFSEYELNN